MLEVVRCTCGIAIEDGPQHHEHSSVESRHRAQEAHTKSHKAKLHTQGSKGSQSDSKAPGMRIKSPRMQVRPNKNIRASTGIMIAVD